jgi:hypothetical protein
MPLALTELTGQCARLEEMFAEKRPRRPRQLQRLHEAVHY